MKFNIIPQRVIEFDIFEKGKKQIWVWVTWGRYDWQTFHTNDFEAFQNCTTIEEIQKVVDEKIKTIKPVTKDKTFKVNKEFVGTNWDNLYNIENLRKAFGTDDSEAFTNVSSGGGANTEIWFEKNLSNKDYNEVIDEEDEGLEPLTIYEAAKRWKDDVLTENGWKNGTDTFYETPLKVVAVKEEPKTAGEKVAEQLGIKHLALLEKLSKAVNSPVKQKKEAVIKKELPKKFKVADIKLLIKYCRNRSSKTEGRLLNKELKFLEKIDLKKFKN